MKTLQKKNNLAEVCPQCCKLIDSSASRLVHDTCGHSKCRICLLQEITGCLVCSAEEKSLDTKGKITGHRPDLNPIKNSELQPRKSVITSLAIQIAEQKETEDSNPLTFSFPSVDKDTCHLIKQSLKKDILFPTDIVKRSTGNFYNLKRVFSQRFFNEGIELKKNKACETEEKWFTASEKKTGFPQNEDPHLDRRNWKLPSHIQVQYFCTIHSLTLDQKNVLKYHMGCTSDGEKTKNQLYQCKICEKEYKVISKLNRHMIIHTKNSRFKCTKCSKSCTDNYALKTHERTHSDHKPYSCSYCKKKFSGLQNFKRHEKKHRNEKKFICNECGFQFLTKTELKRHGVTHTNIKSFSCQICFRKFTFKRTLMRHTKIHDANLTKLKCLNCDSTFKRKDNLERHVKTAHFDLKKN